MDEKIVTMESGALDLGLPELDEKYQKYDRVIEMSIAEAIIQTKDKDTIILDVKDATEYGKVLYEIFKIVNDVYGKHIYVKMNFFKYWFLKLFGRINFPRYSKRLNLVNASVYEWNDACEFFERPCQSCNEDIYIIPQIYEEYYKKG